MSDRPRILVMGPPKALTVGSIERRSGAVPAGSMRPRSAPEQVYSREAERGGDDQGEIRTLDFPDQQSEKSEEDEIGGERQRPVTHGHRSPGCCMAGGPG
jgi:hypothetical protein